MGSMQWQLGREMGTIPAFASRTQEKQQNLCRDGRSTWVEMAGVSAVIGLQVYTNTGCPRRNVQYFGRVFLMLNYTDINQNTYTQS